MNIKFLALLILPILLFARENPFKSSEEMKDIPLSNNYIQAPNDFKKSTFKLPESARIIDSVEIVYQNIDGSIAKKRIPIDNRIDWTKDFMLTYSKPIVVERKKPCPKCQKCKKVTTIKKTIREVIEKKLVPKKEVVETVESQPEITETTEINGVLVENGTVEIPEEIKAVEERKVISIGKPRFAFFEFFEEDHKIKINTTDPKKRHFMLVRPNRIILDFYRDTDFQNQTFDISKGIFREMKISTEGEKGIYRVAIYIAEGYRYKLEKTEVGYEVKCYKR
ncbi:hypothetical protein ThvES_00017190 [Thiovulum sp. ES]|nr:hypothetical protein ThvES_00017190 [Thiovulum sp. ES]